MIKVILVIIILIFIAYGVLELIYHMYVKDRQDMEKDLLKLEKRTNENYINFEREYKVLKQLVNDLYDEIEELKKGKKKNEK